MELKIRLRGIYQDYIGSVTDAMNEMLYEYPLLKRIIKIVYLSIIVLMQKSIMICLEICLKMNIKCILETFMICLVGMKMIY